MLSLPHGRAALRNLSRIGIPNGVAALIALAIALPASAHVRTTPAPIHAARELASARASNEAAIDVTPIKLYDGPTEFHVFTRSEKLASGVRASLAEENIREVNELRPESWQVVDTMHARHYSPLEGRFLSPDPVLGDPYRPQTWNRYAYVHNNPVTLNDPDGRCEVVCVAVILGVVGGLFLADDVANAPAPGDRLIPNAGVASSIYGSAQGVATAVPVNAFLNPATVTRYMGPGEAETAKRTGNIPNADADGNPRPTHVTTDKPLNSSADAKEKYELPKTPTHRATVPQSRVPGGLGPTPDGRPTTSGGGSQSATNQPIPVKPNEIKPLDRTLWQRVLDLFK